MLVGSCALVSAGVVRTDVRCFCLSGEKEVKLSGGGLSVRRKGKRRPQGSLTLSSMGTHVMRRDHVTDCAWMDLVPCATRIAAEFGDDDGG